MRIMLARISMSVTASSLGGGHFIAPGLGDADIELDIGDLRRIAWIALILWRQTQQEPIASAEMALEQPEARRWARRSAITGPACEPVADDYPQRGLCGVGWQRSGRIRPVDPKHNVSQRSYAPSLINAVI
jgi:hypothetical protein